MNILLIHLFINIDAPVGTFVTLAEVIQAMKLLATFSPRLEDFSIHLQSHFLLPLTDCQYYNTNVILSEQPQPTTNSNDQSTPSTTTTNKKARKNSSSSNTNTNQNNNNTAKFYIMTMQVEKLDSMRDLSTETATNQQQIGKIFAQFTVSSIYYCVDFIVSL